MAVSVLLILLIFIAMLLLFVGRRARAARHRSREAPRPAFNPISPERIAGQYHQLQQTIAQLQGPPQVLAHHGYPDSLQWLILLQQAPHEAADLHDALGTQFAIRGAYSELITMNSLIAYAAAQQYLQTHGPLDILQEAQAQSQATLDAGYPNEQKWYLLLTADRKDALRVRYQLDLELARFGISAPPSLAASIAAFERAEQSIRAEADRGEPGAG